jgi:sulfate transport system permease protein
MGLTLTYLSLVVLIPLSMLFVKAGALDLKDFVAITTAPRVLASYRLSFLASLAAASINVCLGFLLAWVLVRYEFPGRRFIDGLVDLPFALPTAVAGIVLATLYSPLGWLGRPLAALGIKVAFTPVGVVLALSFVGFPFVVRTVQPVLQSLAAEDEEAAACLGASRFQIFVRLILPTVLPAVTTGFALAFARALGEYGSVVFISGNLPMRTEIPPLLIMSRLDQFDYQGASAIAVVMLVASFVVLLLTHVLKWWGRRIGAWG